MRHADDCFAPLWHCFDVYAYVLAAEDKCAARKPRRLTCPSTLGGRGEREREREREREGEKKREHKIFTADAYSCDRDALVPAQVTRINMHKIFALLGIQGSTGALSRHCGFWYVLLRCTLKEPHFCRLYFTNCSM